MPNTIGGHAGNQTTKMQNILRISIQLSHAKQILRSDPMRIHYMTHFRKGPLFCAGVPPLRERHGHRVSRHLLQYRGSVFSFSPLEVAQAGARFPCRARIHLHDLHVRMPPPPGPHLAIAPIHGLCHRALGGCFLPLGGCCLLTFLVELTTAWCDMQLPAVDW